MEAANRIQEFLRVDFVVAAMETMNMNRPHPLMANRTAECMYHRDHQVPGRSLTAWHVWSSSPHFRFSAEVDRTVITFDLQDDYSFGILQSNTHLVWLALHCSSMHDTFRFDREAFESYPWPQMPWIDMVRAVAEAAVHLRRVRGHGEGLEQEAQRELDRAVREAYRMNEDDDPIDVLLELNEKIHQREVQGSTSVCGPGLPTTVREPEEFFSQDLA